MTHHPWLMEIVKDSIKSKENAYKSAPYLHTFGLWQETGAPGGNPHRHRGGDSTKPAKSRRERKNHTINVPGFFGAFLDHVYRINMHEKG